MNTKTIKFDLNKFKLYEKIKAKQGDTKSRFLLFQLLDGSAPFNLKNRSVRAYMIKPDGKEIFNDLIVNNYNLGYCTLELTNQVLAVPGTLKIELMVTEEEKKLTSSVFELEVIKSINSEKSIVSTNEFTALLNGLAALSEYDNYKNAVKEMEINKADKAKVEEKFGKVYEQLDNIENKIVELKADKTGQTDISEILKTCIEKANTEHKNVFIPKGDYKIDKIVELLDINNVSIECEIGTKFIVNLTDIDNYNVIKFNNSNNINFSGGKCVNINDDLRSRSLYNGAFLTFNNCSFVEVHNCISENMNYLVQLNQRCHDALIYNNEFYNSSIKEQSSMSAILCYSSYNVDIYNNFIQGQTYDGTISVFGSGSNNVNVYNNRMFNYFDLNTVNYLSQGITIDQGCKFVNVYNNEIRGYWYGVDVKSNVEFIDVYDNTVKGCKIAITNRDGEATEGTSTNEVYIRNNKITFNELYHKNLDNFQLDGFQQIGISAINRYGCKITNNEILVDYTMTTPCCGIYVKPNTTVSKDYLEETIINNNKISLLYAFSTFYYANDGSCALFINSGKNIKIKGNYLRFYSSRSCNTILFKGENTNLFIEENTIKNQNPSMRLIKLFDDSSTLKNSIIQNNRLEDTTILICDDVIIETKNNYFKDNFGFRKIIDGGYTSKLVLGNNTADTLYRITTQHTPTMLFNIKVNVYNTGQCISGLLSVKITNGTASLTNSQVQGNENIRFEIQNNGTCDFNIRINNQTGESIRLYSILELLSVDQITNII